MSLKSKKTKYDTDLVIIEIYTSSKVSKVFVLSKVLCLTCMFVRVIQEVSNHIKSERVKFETFRC